MLVTTLAPVLAMSTPQVKEPQAASHEPRAVRRVVATKSGGVSRTTRALPAVCCLLSVAFAVQPGFDASKVVRQVRGVARPASGIEQGLDDGEFLLDTSITAVPACHTQDEPATAFDGTNFLVVWHDWRDNDDDIDIYGARVSQTGTELDPAGIPICIATGDQAQPVVAFDGANYLVVWTDRRGESEDICGARVSQSGAVLDTEFIPVSTATYNQDYPALSFDGTKYLVVWTDRRNGNDDIYGARVSLDGTVLDPQGIAICDTTGTQGGPVVSFDGTNFLVVWCDGRSGAGSDIYGARVSPSGSVLDPQGIAICDTMRTQGDPAVSFDGANFLVVWADSRDTGEYKLDIYGARVTQAGTVLDPDGLPISTADGLQGSPAVSFDGTNYLVTWGSGDDIYGARVARSGSVLDSLGFAVSAATDEQESPAVSFGGTDYLVVWNDGRSPSGWSDVYGARVSTSGTVLEPEGIPVATEAHWQWSPAVSFDGTNFLAVWEDYRYDPDTSCIYGARVSQSGAILDPRGFAISTAAHSPAVSFDGTNFLVVWEQYAFYPGMSDIYGTRVSQSGVVLDSQGFAISIAAGFQWSPAVSFDGASFLVVWEDARNGAGDVYGARVSPAGEVLDPDGMQISTAEREQFGTDVSFDGTNYLVVWGDNRHVTGTDIYGARVSPSGAVIDTSGILISATSRWLWSPVLSFDGANHLVVWAGSDNRFDTIYDIHGARVSPAGVVLDTSGITLFTAEYPRPYPAVAFDGTNHLVMWERERSGSPRIYGVRVTPQGIPFDSGTAVTGLHGSGGSQLAWPAFLALARGTGNLSFLVYASRAGTVGGKAYNAQRIWGKMNAAPGIQGEENAEVRRVKSGATIVRGVLFLPRSLAPSISSCLLDISGRKVLDLCPGPNDVRALAPGVYFVREEIQAASRKPQAVHKVVVAE